MSAHSKTVVLAPDARVDFTDILLFTLRELGDEQSVRYEALLVRAMSDLADHPEVGVRRDRLFPGCRIRPVEQHVLYYRVVGDNKVQKTLQLSWVSSSTSSAIESVKHRCRHSGGD